ncbi:unnamed protein product [Hydatigera taeniaeformis]|uniref:RNA-directed DNA polymerase-like protein n=1 Tax=Hydatigena taeniaeformis TaxID=6205 RepID=A0A0R3X9P8_HYDTA|nr:unnamed protein product [Hydatigera taeniaeformis]
MEQQHDSESLQWASMVLDLPNVYTPELAMVFNSKCDVVLLSPQLENVLLSSDILQHPHFQDVFRIFRYCSCRLTFHNSAFMADSIPAIDFPVVVYRAHFSKYHIVFAEMYEKSTYLVIFGLRFGYAMPKPQLIVSLN